MSLAPLTLPALGPAAFLRCAAAAGYREVALRLIGGDPLDPPADMPPLVRHAGELPELRAILDGEGLSVSELEVLTIAPATDIAASRPMLEMGAALGARELVLCIDDADRGRAADRLAEAAALAGELGLFVDVEFVPYMHLRTIGEAAALLAASGAANAAILVDALHLARSGGDAATVAAMPRPLFRYLQLCDAPLAAPGDLAGLMGQAREARLDPGKGGLDVAALVRAMPGDMPVSVEVPNVVRIAALGAVRHAVLVREATERLLIRIEEEAI
jgi:sugar phosphate isomerase/epimerase